MRSTRIRIKILILLILGISTFELRLATAEETCGPQQCVRVTENGRPVGYGCIVGGTLNRVCTATLSGCFFDVCSAFLE